MTHPQIPPDTVIEPREALAEALAEGLHKAMCYRPTTLHNRLACERPAVYLNLALAAIEHPALRAALAAVPDPDQRPPDVERLRDAVQACLVELSESPLPGARYAYEVVRRRFSAALSTTPPEAPEPPA